MVSHEVSLVSTTPEFTDEEVEIAVDRGNLADNIVRLHTRFELFRNHNGAFRSAFANLKQGIA